MFASSYSPSSQQHEQHELLLGQRHSVTQVLLGRSRELPKDARQYI
jgi:hypothetical protein